MGRLLTAAGVGLLAGALSGCWLQPGFDAGRTNDNPDETTLTSDNIAGLTELWETDVGDVGVHAPISRAGTVYVTSSEGNGSAAALDAATGAIRWQVDEILPALDFTPPALGAPAYHDGAVVAPAVTKRPGSGPGWGGLARIDPRTGEVLDGGDGSMPSTDVAIARGTPAVRGYDAHVVDGIGWEEISWVFPRNPVIVADDLGNPPTIGEFAVVGDRIAWSEDATALGYSEDCPAVVEGVDLCLPDWTTPLDGNPGQPVALGADRVAYSTATTTYVLDMPTGDVLWTADVGGGGLAATDTTLLVADRAGGRVVALPTAGCGASTCDPLWEAAVDGLTGGPVVGGDVVYVRTAADEIVALDRDGCGSSACAPLVTLATGEPLAGGLIVDHGRVTVTTTDGKVVAYGLAG